MPAQFSQFASSVGVESAFSVLAIAKRLIAAGKDVIELEIGDSPFSTPPKAIEAGVQAIRDGHSRYGPSLGIMDFRNAAAEYVNREYGLSVTGEHVIAGPGAKNFEQLFCEAFLNPGDGVLVFSPHFPTYPPNIFRRDARMVLSELKASHDFRPSLEDVRRFLNEDKAPKAIFLNSPHNPTGGVALFEDLKGIADLIRGRDVVVFSDEPYDRMVWRGRHHSIPSRWIRSVDDKVTIAKTADEAHAHWRDEERSQALFGDDNSRSERDVGASHNLNRSFSGTY